MSDNMKLWNLLGRTDPAHTHPFKRSGGFSGTAIKPMFSYRRMTEEFGPCGEGWGVGEPVFQVVPGPEGEVLVYCTASIWFGERTKVVYGVGGDKAVGKNKYGLVTDDEAFKKAFTDAITNALKLIGVGADVHMGMFDDNKYVNAIREDFKTVAAVPDVERKSSASLKRDDAWNKLMFKLSADFGDCKSRVTLSKLRGDYREMARSQGWPRAWLEALAEEFDQFEDKLPLPDDGDVFPGDLPSGSFKDKLPLPDDGDVFPGDLPSGSFKDKLPLPDDGDVFPGDLPSGSFKDKLPLPDDGDVFPGDLPSGSFKDKLPLPDDGDVFPGDLPSGSFNHPLQAG